MPFRWRSSNRTSRSSRRSTTLPPTNCFSGPRIRRLAERRSDPGHVRADPSSRGLGQSVLLGARQVSGNRRGRRMSPDGIDRIYLGCRGRRPSRCDAQSRWVERVGRGWGSPAHRSGRRMGPGSQRQPCPVQSTEHHYSRHDRRQQRPRRSPPDLYPYVELCSLGVSLFIRHPEKAVSDKSDRCLPMVYLIGPP